MFHNEHKRYDSCTPLFLSPLLFINNMASLPPALDFPKTEEEICSKWAEEQTFKKQDELALERGDEVCLLV